MKLPESYIRRFDRQKAKTLRQEILRPRGYYKYRNGEWTTPSGNPPNHYKGMEFDFGT